MTKESMRDEKLSRLYRSTARDEPPPALDAAVLAAARQAVTETSKRRRRPWWRAWAAPTGLVATAILGLGVSLMVEHEHRQAVDESIAAPVAETSPLPVPHAPLTEAEPAPSVTGRAAKPVRAPQAQAHKEQPSLPAQAPPATPKAAPPRAFADVAPTESRSDQAMSPSVQAESPSAPAASASVQAESRSAPEAKMAPPALASPAGNVASRAAPTPAAEQQRSAKKMAKPESVTEEVQRGFDQWVEDIRQLRRDGHNAEAETQLAELQKAYPNHTLPEDLRRH